MIEIFNCIVTENYAFIFLKIKGKESRNGAENTLDNNWKRTTERSILWRDQFLSKRNSSETLKRSKYDSPFNVYFPSYTKIDTVLPLNNNINIKNKKHVATAPT